MNNNNIISFGLLFCCILLLSIALHLYDLDKQALHHDESMHVFYSWFISKGDLSAFNNIHSPMMHGPFQFFFNSFIFMLLGDSDYTARLLPAIFGVLLTLLTLLFRKELGNTLTLVFAFSVTISPTFLYFSRFARNDIYVAVWSLIIVVCFLRYQRTGKYKYLLISSVTLGLFFITKESAYIFTAILLLYLLLNIIIYLFNGIFNKTDPRKIFRYKKYRFQYFIFLLTLTLPIGGAGFILFQNQLNLTLGSTVWPNIGLPDSASTSTALFITYILCAISMALISIKKIFKYFKISNMEKGALPFLNALIIAFIFFMILILFHTSFFTKFDGVKIAFWQSLGYWITQHDVARGDQPWFYYLMLSLTYEYTAFILGTLSAIVFLFKGNSYQRFLGYWTIASFIFYSYAGEKMPWLLVEVILPFYIVTFFGLKVFLNSIEKKIVHNFNYIYCLSLFLVVLIFSSSIMSTVRLVYTTPGFANQLLVYVQTSPHIVEISKYISNIAKHSDKNQQLSIQIDTTDGFSWPWAWYFRNYKSVSYKDFTNNPLTNPNQASDIILLSERNKLTNNYFINEHHDPQLYIHRWWNPEVYKDFNLSHIDLLPEITDNGCKLVDYFINRRLDTNIGLIYANIYVRENLGETILLTNFEYEDSSCH